MAFRVHARPLQPKDVGGCVEIIAAHPILRERYRYVLADLPGVLLSLMTQAAFGASVFEEIDNASVRLLGAGVATFVRDDFLREMKKSPTTWATPELVTRVKQGNSPLLSQREIRAANSDSGLSLFVWHSGLSVDDVGRSEVAGAVISAFFDDWRGYQIKEICQQAETWHHFLAARAGGCYVVHPGTGRYVNHFEATENEFEKVPLLLGMSREVAQQAPGSWLGTVLFRYEPPRFYFTRGQQRLLSVALAGATDEELADLLGISYFAVKKVWREIYDRSSSFFADWDSTHVAPDGAGRHRGKQRRHRLLAYLREHPEEMRPIRKNLSSIRASSSLPASVPRRRA